MTEKQRNAAVGAFVILGFVLLVGIIVQFANLATLLRGGYRVTVYLDHSKGIIEGKTVHFNGVEIGTVDQIEIVEGGRRISLIVRIEQAVDIPSNAELHVMSTALGDAYIDVRLPQDSQGRRAEPGPAIPKDGTARLAGTTAGGQLVPKSLTDRVEAFLVKCERIDEVVLNLAAMTEPRTPEEVDAGEKPPNLAVAIARFDAAMAKVADDENAANLKTTLANLADASTRFNDTLKRADEAFAKAGYAIDKMTSDAGEVKDKTTRLLGKLYDDAVRVSTLLDTFNSLAKGVQEGEGTVGKLLKSDELHRQLQLTILEMQDAFKQVRILMQKLQTEGLLRKGD